MSITKNLTTEQSDKVDNISVTQPVNLDTIESDVVALNSASHAAVTKATDDTTDESIDIVGQEITVNQVAIDSDGVMSSEDKVKLDAITGTNTGDQDLSDLVDKTNAQTVGGVKTFTSPIIKKEGAGSGLSADAAADLIVIDSDQTNRGMSILTVSGGNSNLYFGEAGNAAKAGHIQYIGSANSVRVGAGNVNNIALYADRMDMLVPEKLFNINTVGRDALTPSTAWVIWNTDTNKPEWYDGSSWITTGGAAADMAALVVERTTAQAITTSHDLTFDVTGVENDTAVLEHNNTNTERIDIKSSGLHQVSLSLSVTNAAVSDKILDLKLKVDGTPVKTISVDISKSQEDTFTRMTQVVLTAGTYLTFEVSQNGGGSDLTVEPTTVATIVKMQGTKGDTGDTGAGSNIIVQDEGVTQGTVIDTIDFVGNAVSVTEAAGKATVTVNTDWRPNSIPLGSVLVSGASFIINSSGAGVYMSMSGVADDAFFFNDSLNKSGSAYNGSDLALVLHCRLSASGGGGDNVGLLLDYGFIRDGDNAATTVTNVAQVNYDVSTEIQDEQFDIQLTTMTGVATADTIMISVTRNSSGAGADTFSGNLEIIGLEFKVI